jgi:hypothetical protein
VGKKRGSKTVFDLIENFADELIRNGIQKKKPKAIPYVWTGRKGRESMAKYNGKGPSYCKNCGRDEGIHRADDMACPANGGNQTGSNNPMYLKASILIPRNGGRNSKTAQSKDNTSFIRTLITTGLLVWVLIAGGFFG